MTDSDAISRSVLLTKLRELTKANAEAIRHQPGAIRHGLGDVLALVEQMPSVEVAAPDICGAEHYSRIAYCELPEGHEGEHQGSLDTIEWSGDGT